MTVSSADPVAHSVSAPLSIKSPTLHATIWFTMAVFVTMIVMAFLFRVEVVARGQGKVVPISRVQVVQPEFDGKIISIETSNGARVRRGDILVTFDATDAKAQVNTVSAEMERLKIERARIAALVEGIDTGSLDQADGATLIEAAFNLPDYVDHPFYAEQSRLLSAQILDLQASLGQIASRIEANEQSVAVTRANIERIEAGLAIQRERLDVIQELLDREVASRSAFLDIQESFISLEKERDVYLKELDQKRTQESAILSERRSLIAAKRSTLLNRRSEIQARLATLSEELTAGQRRIEAAQLRAPMDGIIDQFEIYTLGAVVKSGDDLMRVVPEDQTVEIEALFTNSDIGFIEIGQRANLNLDAYPSARFGYVEGTVTDVAADSTEVSDGEWAYSVRIRPDQNMLESGGDQFLMRPGMTASVDVTTDKRRLISYFFAPIVDTVQSALGER